MLAPWKDVFNFREALPNMADGLPCPAVPHLAVEARCYYSISVYGMSFIRRHWLLCFNFPSGLDVLLYTRVLALQQKLNVITAL